MLYVIVDLMIQRRVFRRADEDDEMEHMAEPEVIKSWVQDAMVELEVLKRHFDSTESAEFKANIKRENSIAGSDENPFVDASKWNWKQHANMLMVGIIFLGTFAGANPLPQNPNI